MIGFVSARRFVGASVALVAVLVVGCGGESGGGDLAPAPDLATDQSQPDLAMASDLASAADLTPVCTGSGTVDVNQALGTGETWLQGPDVLGQGFTVGRSGNLTGIGLALCSQNAPSGTLTLSIFDGAQKLGSTTAPTSVLQTCASGVPMFNIQVGCIPVTAGMSLRFELSSNVGTVACGYTTSISGFCPNSGLACSASQPCTVFGTASAAGTSPDYTLNGASSGKGALQFLTRIE